MLSDVGKHGLLVEDSSPVTLFPLRHPLDGRVLWVGAQVDHPATVLVNFRRPEREDRFDRKVRFHEGVAVGRAVLERQAADLVGLVAKLVGLLLGALHQLVPVGSGRLGELALGESPHGSGMR